MSSRLDAEPDREVVSTSQYPPQPPPLPRPARSGLGLVQIQAMLDESQDTEEDFGSQDMN